MGTNATIDITSFVSSADSSTKSYADNKSNSSANGFENIFASVNKTYKTDASNANSQNNVAQNNSNSKKAATNSSKKIDYKDSKENKDSKVENSDTQNQESQQTNTDKKVDDDSQQTSGQDSTLKTETTEKDLKTTTSEDSQTDTTAQDTTKTELVPTEVVIAQAQLQLDPNVVGQQTPKVETKPNEKEQKTDDKTDEIKGNDDSDVTSKTTPVTVAQQQIVDNTQLYNQPIVLTNEAIDILKTSQNTAQEDTIKPSVEPLQGQTNAISNNLGATAQTQVQTPDVQANITTQNTENTVKNQSATSGVNAQQNEQKAQDTQSNQASMPQTDVAETKMPVIQTNTEIIASNVSVNDNANTKPSETELVDKSKLSQEMINKTNAKVISAESGSANHSGSNLLNQQSPQEQGVKMALENNSKTISKSATDNSDLTKLGDAGQITFAKTLDNVQTQAPKELNKTDILSQINNQLNTLKEETTSKVSIILKPENLGKITLELTNGKDGLVAKMTTDNAQVKELLDKHLDSLKDTLGNQGVNVNNVTVKVNETQKQDNMFSFGDQKGQGNQQAFENKNANGSNENKGNGVPLDEEMDISTESVGTEAELKRETSISMSSHLGKVDYKI